MVEVFRTADVPRGERAAYWADVYTSAVAPIAVPRHDGGPFQAELKVGTLGAVEFACVKSRPTSVERTLEQARKADRRMLGFVIVVRGSGVVSHCGHEVAVEAGDIVLSDNTEPMQSRFDVPVEGVTVRAPEAALRARLPNFEDLRGRRLPGTVGLTETGVGMAKCLSTKLEAVLPEHCAVKASGHLLDVLATSYALAFATPAEEASLAAARRARVNAFIEANLNDPDLTPCLVADALRISPRYLRKLMAGQGETASSFILRRRLEECARELSSDVRRARSITDVAFSWGFNSTAHFARVFKSKYGVSPREFRPTAAGS